MERVVVNFFKWPWGLKHLIFLTHCFRNSLVKIRNIFALVKLFFIKNYFKFKAPQNCWLFNGNLNDSCKNAHLLFSQNKQFNFTNDRFDNPESAVNESFLLAPPAVYFSGDFTSTFWIYLRSIPNYSEL